MSSLWKRRRVTASGGALAMLLACTACGSDEPGPSPTSTSSATVESAIDECLVGTWKTVSQRQDSTIDNTPVVIVDNPRTLEFTADGREVVRYVEEPAAVTDSRGKKLGTITYKGTVAYRVDTDEAGTISFVVEEGAITATLDLGGQPQTSTFDGASNPVDYTCDDDTLTQRSDGYEAEFERS